MLHWAMRDLRHVQSPWRAGPAIVPAALGVGHIRGEVKDRKLKKHILGERHGFSERMCMTSIQPEGALVFSEIDESKSHNNVVAGVGTPAQVAVLARYAHPTKEIKPSRDRPQRDRRWRGKGGAGRIGDGRNPDDTIVYFRFAFHKLASGSAGRVDSALKAPRLERMCRW